MDSLSNSGLAHPPRSNPRLRSSTCSPPFPCITPSTETCVVVVSFMIAVPFSLGLPSWAAAHPCYEHLRPDPTLASRISFEDFLVRRLQAIRQRDGFRGDCAPLPHVRI